MTSTNNENSSYERFNHTSIKKKLSKKISKGRRYTSFKKKYNTLNEDISEMSEEETTFVTPLTQATSMVNTKTQEETRRKTSEFVRVAAAKKKQDKENDLVKASTSSKPLDELRVLFAGKHARKPRYSEEINEIGDTPSITNFLKSQNTTIDQAAQEEDNFYENLLNKKHEIKNDNDKDEDEPTEISHDEIQHDMKRNLCKPNEDIESCIFLLLTLEISIESEIHESFFQRLFQQDQIRELVRTSPLFRSCIQFLL